MSQRQPPQRPKEGGDGGDGDSSTGDKNDVSPFWVTDAPEEVLYEPGSRYTGNTFILVHETRLIEEGQELDVPARPVNERVAEVATAKIQAALGPDVEPWWKDITEFPTFAPLSEVADA